MNTLFKFKKIIVLLLVSVCCACSIYSAERQNILADEADRGLTHFVRYPNIPIFTVATLCTGIAASECPGHFLASATTADVLITAAYIHALTLSPHQKNCSYLRYKIGVLLPIILTSFSALVLHPYFHPPCDTTAYQMALFFNGLGYWLTVGALGLDVLWYTFCCRKA
jgi:hypothetical protein